MNQSNEQNKEESIQDKGLALGIDFGNSQISAAVWRPDKKAPDMVKFGNKSSFPATLYFPELGERRDTENNPSYVKGKYMINPKYGIKGTISEDAYLQYTIEARVVE